MLKIPATPPVRSHYLAGFLLCILLALFVAPDALGACNKNNKGKDCSPNPNPPTPGAAIVVIDDTAPCLCHGADHPMPEIMLGPLYCNSTAQISNIAGEYFCSLAPGDEFGLMTHHFPQFFNRKYGEICNTLAFPEESLGMPDEVLFGWTEDCSDGDCAITLNLEFSGSRVLSATGGAADALSVVVHGTAQAAPGGDGNPFSAAQDVALESMDLLFLKPGSTRIAGLCTLMLDGSERFSADPVPQP